MNIDRVAWEKLEQMCERERNNDNPIRWVYSQEQWFNAVTDLIDTAKEDSK